jgi:hypothetical protein
MIGTDHWYNNKETYLNEQVMPTSAAQIPWLVMVSDLRIRSESNNILSVKYVQWPHKTNLIATRQRDIKMHLLHSVSM